MSDRITRLERVLEHAEQNGARISLRSVTAPNLMDGLDKSLLGKDTTPSVKETLRSLTEIDEGARRLGELALVDGKGRIGPLDTVFYNTLLDENASSHIALGNGFPFLIEDEDRARGNESAQHIDFMIGSAEMEVDGVTADGERIPLLRNLAWQLLAREAPVNVPAARPLGR